MAGRRYYWLKLPEDFFRRGYIRRLRGLPDGDRLTVIYLEMLLAALKTDGVLATDGAEDPAEELALELYEDQTEVETVLNYLAERGKMIRDNETKYYLTDSEELTGSESADARRVRETRRREKAVSLCAPTENAASSVVVPGFPHSLSDEEFVQELTALRRG